MFDASKMRFWICILESLLMGLLGLILVEILRVSFIGVLLNG
jgi:hypothetical protein